MTVPAAPSPGHVGMVDLIAVQWAGTLVSMDYPTHWNLLWQLGWAKKNADDENLADAPGERYAPVVGADMAPLQGLQKVFENTVPQWLRGLDAPGLQSTGEAASSRTQKLMCCLPGAWVDESAPTPQSWALALQAPRLPALALKRFVDHAWLEAAKGWSNGPVDSFIDFGGSGTGFTALARAAHYLNAMPNEVLWLAAWSAPKPGEVRDAGQHWVLMALAQPGWAARRGLAPLARLAMPTRVMITADAGAEPNDGALGRAAGDALKQTLAQIALRPRAIARIFHDAGVQNERDRVPLSALLQGTHLAGIELTDPQRLSGLGDWPGDSRGPAAALLNLALASAHVHHTGRAVLCAGVTDPAAAYSVALGPPQAPDTPPTPLPTAPWPRADGLDKIYVPWVTGPATNGATEPS